MKKLTILLAIIFTSFITAQTTQLVEAQEAEPISPWNFGLKAGINFANLKGSYLDLDYVKESNGFVGFHAGGWANYALSQKSSFQFELLGSLQGGDIEYELSYAGQNIKPIGKVRMPYIQIPIMYQYKPLEKLHLEIGPQLNYLPKINLKTYIDGERINDETVENLVNNRLKNARSIDVGLNIGAGYEFIQDWRVYTRYTHGLLTVDDRDENQRDLKNRVLAFGVSYKF